MNFSRRVTEAVTWTLIADIMRRHEATAGLRVLETHPCGGTYDCLTVIQPTPREFGPSVSFNVGSGNATCFGTFGPRRRVERPAWAGSDPDPDRLAYVEAVLRAEHRMPVVNYLEAMLGLPSPERSPATTRHGLAYRVMAEVAARSTFDGPFVCWENGREDTSGYGSDDPVRPAVRRVPELARRVDAAGAPATPADAPGYRYWIWTTRRRAHEPPVPVGVLDALDAVLFRLDRAAGPVDLHERYGEVGRDVRRLVDRILR